MKLAQHLFVRIKEAGVDCSFGIPGDFALPLYGAQQQANLKTIVCSHEPGAAFAADAYARLKGLGVVMTTYGAGALNMVNPVAMSYAERSPVLIVSGAPEIAYRKKGMLMHHMVKSFESQLRVYEEVCCATTLLTDSNSAADEIDRVIEAILTEKRPGYIEFPRDLINLEVRPSGNPLRMQPPKATINSGVVTECANEIVSLLNASEKPVMYVGVEARRHHVEHLMPEIAQAWGMPVLSSVLGKAAFPETHPHYSGFYMGDVGGSFSIDMMNESDCILSIGVIESDVNTGFGTARNDPTVSIRLTHDTTRIHHHDYHDVPLRSIIQAVVQHLPKEERKCWKDPKMATLPNKMYSKKGPLKTDHVIEALRDLDESNYSFIADIGDSWFIGLEVKANVFMAAGYYASMGFAVPGAVGAGIAARHRRPLVIVGDGAFQMTGNELGTLVDADIPATVLLLNNSSYMMLETFDGERAYYDRRPWDYVNFAKSQGCRACQVTTAFALINALKEAAKHDGPYVIEAIIDHNDRSPAMQRIQDWTKARKQEAAQAAHS